MTMDPSSGSNPPAGFFSTFSVLDFNGVTREGPARIQKRNRRVFVCLPCHQRKLKCDKGKPCIRCLKSGVPDECVYQQLPTGRKSREDSASSAPETEDFLKPGGLSPGSSCSDSRTRLHGITNWRSIASEFEEAWPYIMGSDPEWNPRYQQIKDLGCLFSSLPGVAFPLGDACQYSRDRHQVLATFPPRQLMETLLQCYFAAFEPTHRLIHPREFYYELSAFWMDHNQSSDIWLSQLCMMMALGCRAAPSHIFRGSGPSVNEWTDLLLVAAQFFYGGSFNAITPSLTTIRALCLAVMSRMMDIVKGTTETQLVSLMGMTIRLAITMHLHRTTSLFPEIPAFEAEMRKRVWVTIQLLDLDIAMRTGNSYICRDHDADMPLNLDDADVSLTERGWAIETLRCAAPETYTDSSFQIKLADMLPLLAEITNAINSPTQQNLEHSRINTWATQLQQKLQDAEDELCLGQHFRPEMANKISTQRQFFSVLVYRTLMAIHHEFVATPQGTNRCPRALRTVIQSSVALLHIQKAWHCGPSPQASQRPAHRHQTLSTSGMPVHHSRPPTPLHAISTQSTMTNHMTSWLADLCHDDFGAAMLYLMLALRGSGGGRDTSTETGNSNVPIRAELWSILRQSLSVLADRARQSISHFKEFMGLSIAAGCLESMDTGGPILPVLHEVAAEIERRVLFDGGDGRELGMAVGVGVLDIDPRVWPYPESTSGGAHDQHQHLVTAPPMDFPAGMFKFGV